MAQGFINSQNITLPLAVAQGGTGVGTSTGTGSTVLSTSPTLVTPVLGAATATSLTFSPTTGGIVGTTTANDADAGKVGEIASSIILDGSAVSITTATATNLTSISLTAGDWDVWGNINYLATGTTSITGCYAWINTASAALPNAAYINVLRYAPAAVTGAEYSAVSAPYRRISVSGTTTVYLSGYATFTVSTLSMRGGITARRAR